ncbi:DEAD/DEAH box helicase [Pseudonocardia spirodelae]|uniref:Type ISP restriction/modification enzyme n=1 Tax=Pseudonocardia spirodelae TaxID=3133431 RepID=A0ABU8TDN1_9PSEU
MAITIQGLLDDLRETALDERDKGDRFERLVQAYMRTDPVWSAQFENVWLWSEWPARDRKRDTGIDLVAEERGTGQLAAIQCKFYSANHRVQKSDLDSFFTASGKTSFSRRIIVTTSDSWSEHAEDALKDQHIVTQRLDVSTLNDSVIDWDHFQWSKPATLPTKEKKKLRAHQLTAVADVRKGFQSSERGKLIMACGTGKTFTSLRLAEDIVGPGGRVLFLVPSISLLSQSIREWVQESVVDLRSFAVCSDVKVGRGRGEDMSSVDLEYPATTNASKLVEQIGATSSQDAMTVVFSTYQSIAAVAAAQEQGIGEFDLVICDEAHRTTGVTLAGADESSFVRVHNSKFIRAQRRLYMTATPRIYDDSSKTKAAEGTAVLASMDDSDLFGPEFHRLGFGEAVEKGLLSDYKVLVLAVDESVVSRQFQQQLSDDDHELGLDDAAKLVGCWSGLAKRGVDESKLQVDLQPMRRAVAFAENIRVSKRIARLFETVSDQLAAQDADSLECEARHVDGTFNVLERNRLLDWLKADVQGNTCRILSNARCLSEGVDVPALDAVLFLNPRNSVVDVVQSVGRVMRRAEGKEYGYVILPIGVPADMPPEDALSDNSKYRVVWQVLQALRAHDDRFNAMVNKIELNRSKDDKLQVIGIGSADLDGGSAREQQGAQTQIPLTWSDEWRDAIYARIVSKVGDRRYWEDWARDIADIADRHVVRIRTALEDDSAGEIRGQFSSFHDALRANLNDSITEANAIEMLAQHIITKPVFDALFESTSFSATNPVAVVMQEMLDALDSSGLEKESESLDSFYASVRMRAAGIDNGEGKQRIVTELYERFFQNAFPKTAESLGIVYTPVEIVDFILRSVDHLLRSEFDASLNDEGVHFLDPFTGTGTFIVRLLQSDLISPNALMRKYTSELHANEINLLAYYVAAVNIETTFHGLLHTIGHDYQPFDGIVLTDTFQMHEFDDALDDSVFVRNNDRVVKQKQMPIRVIAGNPPYSVGQTTANDGNEKLKYPTLDSRIDSTYNKGRGRGGNNALYDSYIRAIRWASDRLGDQGVIAYVSNGGYLDSNLMGGLRKCLVDEFDSIYVFNLRGNGRIAGENGRKEGRPIFEDGRKGSGGSRTTIAITFLVKRPGAHSADTAGAVYYSQVADYLTARQKLDVVGSSLFPDIDWEQRWPDKYGDWFDQRDDDFDKYDPIGDKLTGRESVFTTYSRGLETGRDSWVYNFSAPELRANILTTAEAFNSDLRNRRGIDLNPRRISWTNSLRQRHKRGEAIEVDNSAFTTAVYRPFTKVHAYYNKALNHIEGRLRRIFPTGSHQNLCIYNVGMGSDVPFSVLMVDRLPDLHVTGAGSGGQVFPRWSYESVPDDGGLELFDQSDVVGGFRRVDNIPDSILAKYRRTYGRSTTKDDIFFYVYGLLHSPEYQAKYFGDLKKVLPRIPMVDAFEHFAAAGRLLADLHVGYETVNPYPLREEVAGSPADPRTFTVQKMRFAKNAQTKKIDRTTIVVNSNVSLHGIPDEAYAYTVGPRSAIEWVMDRYQLKPADKNSGLVNDPNMWAVEQREPRYIVDLLKRIVTVSIETRRVVEALPSIRLSAAAEE